MSFAAIILSAALAVSAVAAEPHLSADTQQLLSDANRKRTERLRERFEPVLRNLDRGSVNGFSKLYMDAVFDVFFAKDSTPQRSWQEWQKKNRSLVIDPRLPWATQLAALDLRGHLFLLLDDEKSAIACFDAVLESLGRGSADLAGFHLLQESLRETLLVKYFRIDDDYLKLKDRYTGAIAEVEPLFLQNVWPWYRAHDPQHAEAAWDRMIAAAQRISQAKEDTAAKFTLTYHPRLLTQKANALWELGQKEAALKTLADILKNFPENPDFKKTEEKLIEWSARK